MMTKTLITEIKEQTSITDIVKEHVDLNRNNMGLCPFHEDTNPSFSVNAEDSYFHCFGCGEGGDVIRFLQLIDNITFPEAVERLAARCGLTVPSGSDIDTATYYKQRKLRDILRETARYYAGKLREEDIEHLNEVRHINEETIRRFIIGYADGNLHRHLIEQKGFDPELCIEAGVIRKSDSGYRDHFYDRLIFPFIVRGNVVNLTGRACGDSESKYLHLPGTIDHLYNEDACRTKTVFIVEGPTDCLSLEQNGYRAVAIVGRNLKPEHIEKFSRCKIIYVCLDGDQPGRESAVEIAEQFGDRAMIISLPDGLDPNEFLTER